MAVSRLPNLLLAGVGKAGTTSLFWYLSQHQSVCPSTVKEPRVFLPLIDGGSRSIDLAAYETYFHRCRGEQYRMEATPHYFHGGARLASELKLSLPDIRVILTLRDPIARLLSIFRFARNMLLLPRDTSVEAFVTEALRLERERESQTTANRPYWTGVSGSMYARWLPEWLDAFDDDHLRVVFFEHLRADPKCVTQGIARWLDIDSDLSNVRFTVENRTVDYRLRSLQRVALAINSDRFLRNRRAWKAPLRRAYYSVNGQKAKEDYPDEVRKSLIDVFLSSNLATADALMQRGYSDLPAWLAGTLTSTGPGAGRA